MSTITSIASVPELRRGVVENPSTWTERGFPTGASGWYQIGWPEDVQVGEVKGLRYFGQDLVLFRTSDGVPHLFDAYCQHLGANLACGGLIVDDRIQCPFHGWQWDINGRNASIPYSKQKVKGRAIRVWHVREAGGLLLTWFDPGQGEPTFDPIPIPEVESGDYYDPYPEGVCLWRETSIHPLSPIENIVDPAHLKYVHGAGEVDMKLDFDARGPYFEKVTQLTFGVGRESTIITPSGPEQGCINTTACGVGYHVGRYRVHDADVADMVLITSTTPIDDRRSDFRITVIPRRDELAGDGWSKLAKWWVKQERRQAEADFPIWENMIQIGKPPFPQEESKAYMAMRKWQREFFIAGDETAE